jgi:hypothetical protein
VKTVASGDKIACDFVINSVLSKSNQGCAATEILHRDVLRLKYHFAACRNPRLIKVVEHLMLRIDDYPFSGKFLEVNPVAASIEAQFDSVVDQSLLLHALANTHLGEQISRVLLEHSSAHAFFYMFSTTVLNHNRFNSLQMQQMREHQPCGARSTNSDWHA